MFVLKYQKFVHALGIANLRQLNKLNQNQWRYMYLDKVRFLPGNRLVIKT